MADTGWLSPGTLVNDTSIGVSGWGTPSNAASSDDSHTIASDFSGVSYYLKATNFGASVPAGATIDGILVSIERKQDSGGSFNDNEVKIVKSDGSIGSTNKADATTWPTTDTYNEYGSSSDLWGETWSYTDINDVDFGVVLSINLDFPYIAYVDHIRIKVYYTETTTDRYWVGSGTGLSWDDDANWSTTSGGSGGASFPTSSNDVYFDANSPTSTITHYSQAFAGDTLYCRNLNATGLTNTISVIIGGNLDTSTLQIHGDIILNSNLNLGHNYKASGNTYQLKGSGKTFTNNGGTFDDGFRVDSGASYTMQDDMVGSGDTALYTYVKINGGTFDFNDYDAIIRDSDISESQVRTIEMSSGNLYLGSGTIQVEFITITGGTLYAETSTVKTLAASYFSSTWGTISASGYSLYDLVVQEDGADYNQINIDSVHNLTIEPLAVARFEASTTLTITNSFVATGTSGNLVYIESSSSGTAATLDYNGKTFSGDYMSIKDSTATDGTFYAGDNSTNVSGNTGWIFSSPVTTVDKTIQAKARIATNGITKTIQAKANVKNTTSKTVQTKASINGVRVLGTELVSPDHIGSGTSPVIFVWEIATNQENEPVHSQIQIDDTSSAFGSLEIDQKSWEDNTGMEYWNGSSWVEYPLTGVTSAYFGNQARLTVALTDTQKWWRVRGASG